MCKQIGCSVCEGGEFIHSSHVNGSIEEISLEYDEDFGQMVIQSYYLSDEMSVLIKEKLESCPICDRRF